jgi:signal transduction histidine kinase/CheY-like chemotaxis protein
VPDWVNGLSAFIDVPWFIAITAWTLALMLWWWRPITMGLSSWRWLPWSAGLGILVGAVHLSHLVFSRLEASPNGPFLWGDLALGGFAAVVAVGWWWSALTTIAPVLNRMRAAIYCALMMVSLGGAAALRYDFYDACYASIVLTVGCAVAALPWLWWADASSWSRVGVIAAAFIPLCSTIGPLAYEFRMLERYTALSPAGLGGACFHALAALLSLAGLARTILVQTVPETRRAIWRDARPIVTTGIAWLLLSLTFAVLVSQRQRTRTEERAFEHVRAMAFGIDPAVLASIESTEFRLDRVPPATVRNAPIRYGFSDYLGTAIAEPANRAFAAIAGSVHTALYVRFVTLRDGWMVSPFNHHTSRKGWVNRLSRSVGAGDSRVMLLRRPTSTDVAAWENKSETIDGPLATPILVNSYMFVRAPVLGSDKRMAGWLEFTFTADEFLSETIQSRVAPLVGMALGAVAAGMFFIQRRQARVREAAVRAAALADEANRVKSGFLAKVSHELRTPLQNLLGYGELLASQMLGDASKAHLAALRQNGELMLRLVNDLLDLGAIEAGVFRLVEKPTALAELIRQSVESLRPHATAKYLRFHFEVASHFPAWLETDGERWRQIVFNLVGNAVKFTEFGGVDIKLRAIPVDGEIGPLSDATQLHGRKAADAWIIELTVRDTGPGIAPAEHAKLFQPFSRLDLTAHQEGSGLGLALTAAFCRSAGGDLKLESDGTSGACFLARLPARLSVAPSSIDSPAAILTGRRVLVADDNALVRELFATYLTSLGATCEVAVDGEQAISRAMVGGFDAIVLDLAMPRCDGFTVARRLRAQLGTPLQIVGVSAHASVSDRTVALAAGMDRFLVKPVELSALAAVLGGERISPSFGEARAELRVHLAQLFRADAPAQRAAITDALARDDWLGLLAAAHYLKNSAAVVRDEPLHLACGRLEDTATRRDKLVVEAAWAECENALALWLR